MDNLNHIIDFFISHSWIDTDPEGISHNAVRIGQVSYDAVALPGFPQFIKAGMFGEIACKQCSCLDAMCFDIPDHFHTIDPFPAGQQKTKPAGDRVLSRFREDKGILHIIQSFTKTCPVMTAPFHKGGQFFQLRATDGRLHI